jgi:hypothetical protein
MEKRMRTGRIIIAIVLSIAFAISGLQNTSALAAGSDKVTVSLVGKYDSADLASIRDIDLDHKLIRFRNHSTGRTYTLSYDNTSMMYDEYGQPLSPSLLEIGEVVDVTFLKSSKSITTLDISKQAWIIEDTRDHELVRGDGTARIKKDVFKLDTRTLVMAEGDLALAEDVLSTDTITVRGVGKDVYSVIVTGGHGYVSLSSDTVENRSLVGAWIELDNEVIHKISPNMLLSAPEGDYKLQILGNGANYQSKVSINRNQETVVDTGKVTISKPKEGLVTFRIKPEDAEVFVDGKKVLTDTPQTIQYGYHNLKIMADGYETQTKYLKVGTPKSEIMIELEPKSDASSSSSSDAASKNKSKSDSSSEKKSKEPKSSTHASSAASSKKSVSENSSGQDNGKNKIIKGYKVYVDEPYGAEVYFDGNYVGMIPCSFQKVSGNHEIILKKEGYKTKSYRVFIDSDEDNKIYKFPELVKIKKDDSSSGSSKPSDSSSEASSEAASDASSGSSSSSDASSEVSSDASSDSSTESGGNEGSDDATDEDSSEASREHSSDDGGEDSSSGSGTGSSRVDDGADDAASTASGN